MADTASLLAERSADDPERLVAAGEDEEGGDPDGGYLEMSIEEAEPPRKKAKWQTTTATIVSNSASGCPGLGAGAGRGKAKGGGEGGREGAASWRMRREREKNERVPMHVLQKEHLCAAGASARDGRDGGGSLMKKKAEERAEEPAREAGWRAKRFDQSV